MLFLSAISFAEKQESAEALFMKAMQMETRDADYEGAIKVYGDIIEKFEKDKKVTKDALSKMLMCYEKLGNQEKANEIRKEIGVNNLLDNTAKNIDLVLLRSKKIHDVLKHGNIATIRKFLEVNPKLIEEKNRDGKTPLHMAISKGNKELVKLLLSLGAWVNARDSKYEWTPLHFAVYKINDIELVKLLILKETNINARTNHGFTALHMAACKDKNLVKLLISKGASINARSRNGGTPLHSAAEQGDKEIVQLLLAKGADINANAGGCGRSPLHQAAQRGDEGIVKLLLEKGANVEARDSEGLTPLCVAAQNGHKDIVKLLLSRGAKRMIFRRIITFGTR